jgi:predicted outer membrane repeat protein
MNRFLLSTIPLLSAMLLLVTGGEAQALCVGLPVKHVFVGDTASDPSCTFNDLQSAIDDAIPNPSCTSFIHVTTEHTYTDQHLTISNRNVHLVAWTDGVKCADILAQCSFSGCPLPTAANNPLVTIAGHDGDSVIHIDGASNVSLLNLTITGGSVDDDQNGGGIYYDGTGSLTLASSTVVGNHAGYGGGIYVNGDGGPASLTLNAHSLILNNTAVVSGGGLHIEGETTVTMDGVQSQIGYNHALTGYGGGLAVNGPARVNIGSPGYGGLGVIYLNDAIWGGGVAAFGIGDAEIVNAAVVKFYTTDSANPVHIQNNYASSGGGAFYAKGHVDFFSNDNTAYICASRFRIDENSAPEGAVAYMDYDSSYNDSIGSVLDLNTGCAAAGGACAPGIPCNIISDNVASDGQGAPTNGAILWLGEDGYFDADGLDMRRNHAGSLVNAISEGHQIQLQNCLLVDNQVSGDLLDLAGYDQVTADNCTFAGNSIGWRLFDYLQTLRDSLIDQSGISAPHVGSALYVLSTDVSNMPSDVTVQTLYDPQFVDAASGDYHLRPTSPAVDFAGGTGGYDLEGKPRDIDLASVTNKFGPRDLGAYELQTVPACSESDKIFCNGFELAN